jgi:hypothetical protein
MATFGLFKAMGKLYSAGKEAIHGPLGKPKIPVMEQKFPTEFKKANDVYERVKSGEEVPTEEIESAMTEANNIVKEKTGKDIKTAINEELKQVPTEEKPPYRKVRFSPEEIKEMKKYHFSDESIEKMRQTLQKRADAKIDAEWEAEHPTPKEEAPKVEDIKSAAVDVGGKTYEGASHKEAIDKAATEGKDVSGIDKEKDGKFVMADGTVKTREEMGGIHSEEVPQLAAKQGETPSKAARELPGKEKPAGYTQQLGQKAKVEYFAKEYPERSKRIALGQEKAPEGVEASSFFSYERDLAVKNRDYAMIEKLRTSSVASLGSKAGQFIKGFDTFSEGVDPIALIKDLETSVKGDIKATVEKEIEKSKGILKDTNVKQLTLDFIKNIECK